MLLTNRRLRTIFIAMAGMEAIVSTVGLLLLMRFRLIWLDTPPLLGTAPLRLALVLWLALLAMILVVDLLGRSHLSDKAYRSSLVALVLATGLGLGRFLASPAGIFDFGWLVDTVIATINFHQGLHPGTFGLLLALFLWWRASVLTDRDVAFLGVGMAFRLGFLLLIGGAGWLSMRERPLIDVAIALLALYLSLGLLAVALTRSDEKASGAAGSAGSALSLGRLAQLLLMVAITVGISLWIGIAYAPDRILATLALLNPLWRVFADLGSMLLIALVFVLEFVVSWLFALLLPLFADLNLAEALAEFGAQFTPGEEIADVAQSDPWPYAALLIGILRATVVIAAIVLCLVLLYIFFVRRQRRPGPDEAESTGATAVDLNANALRRGLDRLRRWADLVRHYGLGTQLLDAITVENIYANLVRLARQRGHPRPPAQPPDEYLPALIQAFPGHDPALERITTAYMRVHYGDHPVSGEELRALRHDYAQIQIAQSEKATVDR